MLSVIAERNDILQQDARWLHRACEHRRVHVGEEVIRPGVPPTHLFVVVEGELEVLAPPETRLAARRLGPGALLWAVRMIPRCSVRAATEGVLLCIRLGDVDARVCADPSFGGRFMRLVTEFALEHCEHAGTPPHAGENGGRGPKTLEPAAFRVPDVIEKLLRGDF